MREKSKINRLTEIEKLNLIANPLVNKEFIINIRKLTSKSNYKIDKDGTFLPVEIEIESDNSVKIYTKAEYRKVIANCSPSAKSIYIHILYELPYGTDYIEINVKRYMDENNISSINTYKDGIAELFRYLIIYPVANIKGVYWINPKLFFAGSRVNKYPKNISIKESKSKDID